MLHKIGSCLWVLSIFLLLVYSPKIAASSNRKVYVDVKLSKDQVKVNEQLYLVVEVTMRDSNTAGLGRLNVPEFTDFSLLERRQNRSISMSMGRISVKLTYQFSIRAKKPGTYNFEPFSLSYQNYQYKSAPFTIIVTDINGAPAPNHATSTRKNSVGKSSMPRQSRQRIGSQSPPPKQANTDRVDAFVRLETDKAQLFWGEQAILYFSLYIAPTVKIWQEPEYQDPPLTGFMKEDIGPMPRRQVRIDGHIYYQYRVDTAIYPTTTGQLSIGPSRLEVKLSVRKRQRSTSNYPFAAFFDQPQMEVRQLESQTLEIEVLPLPLPQPQGFNGAVGQFTVKSWVDKKELKAGNALTLTVNISGTGNLKLITPPTAPELPGVSVYQGEVLSELTATDGNIRYQFVLVPQHAQDLVLPAIELTYFNPQKKRYITDKTSEHQITVLAGKTRKAATETSIVAVSREQIRFLGQDIRQLKVASEHEKPQWQPGLLAIATGFLLPSLLLGGAFGVHLQHKRVNLSTAAGRYILAAKVAAAELNQADRSLASGETELFFTQLQRTWEEYLHNRLGILPSELISSHMESILLERGITNQKLCAMLQQIYAECDLGRFSSMKPAPEMLQKLLTDSHTLLAALNEHTKELG